MPTASVTYSFDSSNDGFTNESANFARITTDGDPGTGCFRSFRFRSGTGATDSAAYGVETALQSWEDLGVPIGETVLSVAVSAKVKVVKKTGTYELRLWVQSTYGGVVPGTTLLNNADLTLQTLGAWETVSGSAVEIPAAVRASDTPVRWDLTIAYQGLLPVDAEVRLDTLEFEIVYGDPPSDPPEDPPVDEGGDPDPVPGGDGVNLCSWRVRNIPAGLLSHLQGECLTLAYLVKLERTDGEVLGFTSHDSPLVYDSTTYSPEAGCQITTLRSEAGARVNNLDLQGALGSPFITDTDLRAGLYDGAELTVYLVNWADISNGALILGRGWMGDVTITDLAWSAEFRSLAQKLQSQIIEAYAPTCSAKQLGVAPCVFNGEFGDGSILTDYQFARPSLPPHAQ